MALETEVKIRLDSAEAGRAMLDRAQISATSQREFESNVLYDTADQRLRAAGELIRIRQVGQRQILTFKAKSLQGHHKIREELETWVGDAEVLAAILKRLGYEPTWCYEKYRTEYSIDGQNGHILLDETPMGTFFEIEGEGPWIDSVAAILGFERADFIKDSYAALFAAHCSAKGLPFTSMTFVHGLDKKTLAS